MTHRHLTLSSVIIVASMSAAAVAQSPTPVSWSASMIPASLARGASSEIQIEARIDPGWHIYSVTQPPGGPIATKIALADGGPLRSAGKPISQPVLVSSQFLPRSDGVGAGANRGGRLRHLAPRMDRTLRDGRGGAAGVVIVVRPGALSY